MRILKIVVLVSVLVAIGGGAWWYGWGPCGRVYIDTAYNQWTDILRRWNFVEDNLQTEPGRVNFENNMRPLWYIRDEMADTVVPACATTAGRSMVKSMDLRLSAYNSAVDQPETIDYFLNIAAGSKSAMADAYNELERIRGCAPFCGK